MSLSPDSSALTNFEKVAVFTELVEQPIFTSLNEGIFDKTPSLVKLRVQLIEEELQELKDAIADRNMTEIADALADLLYVVYGAGHTFGINLDKAFDAVHTSNMTKSCKDEEEAAQTVAHIKDTQPHYKDPAYKLSANGKFYIVYNRDTGKVLKNMNFKQPDLSFIYE